jgi:hypothetical protein
MVPVGNGCRQSAAGTLRSKFFSRASQVGASKANTLGPPESIRLITQDSVRAT